MALEMSQTIKSPIIFMERVLHKISRQGIEAAQTHARAVERHGKDITAIGVRLKAMPSSTRHTQASIQAAGEWIEELGQEVQARGRSSLRYAEALQRSEGESVADYLASVEAHVEATQLHVQATKIVLEFTKTVLDNQRPL